jgi:hypothetical protein
MQDVGAIRMKPPINTPTYSYVEYPSAVFSLERHEIFPYERFAYTVLRIGVEALHSRELPDRVRVSFSDGVDGNHWWAFNAGIQPMEGLFGPEVEGFHISTTPIAPLLLFGMSHYAAKSLFRQDKDFDHQRTTADLRSFIDGLARHFGQALKTYRTFGLASCIRRFTELVGIQIWDLNKCGLTYDVLIQFVANHEIAHAYVGQLTDPSGQHSAQDQRAFELIVDTLATEWIYNHMIRNTPDTEAYRKFAGVASYKDSIYHNVRLVLEGQILTFLVFAFAGALLHQGRVVLDGGLVHPHVLIRTMIQHVHFMTLVESNFSDHLQKEDFDELDNFYGFYMSLFAKAGFFNADDAKAMIDIRTAEDFYRAYELVEKYNIPDLKKSRGLFRFASSLRDKMKSGEGVSFL